MVDDPTPELDDSKPVLVEVGPVDTKPVLVGSVADPVDPESDVEPDVVVLSDAVVEPDVDIDVDVDVVEPEVVDASVSPVVVVLSSPDVVEPDVSPGGMDVGVVALGFVDAGGASSDPVSSPPVVLASSGGLVHPTKSGTTIDPSRALSLISLAPNAASHPSVWDFRPRVR